MPTVCFAAKMIHVSKGDEMDSFGFTLSCDRNLQMNVIPFL